MLLPLVAELNRRRVFRALVGYGIVAFAVLQIIEPVMHGLHWPETVLSYVVVALALGFPVVVTLAWVFDINAGQIERTPPSSLRGPRVALLLVGIGALTAAPGLIWYFVWPGQARRAAEPEASASIAVIPFANLSGDKENEYFSDGVTEELIDALANIDRLRVASRTSVYALKGRNLDAREIGERLKVATLLEGSVRREGNELRVTAQLINVANDVHLWSKTYKREAKGVFALEDEIAQSIAQTLQRRLVGGDSQPPATPSLEAHDHYLKGRFMMAKRTPEALRKAAEYFEQAVQRDSAYTLAYLGLAQATALRNEYDLVPATEVLPKAREAARRALELAPNLAEAHATLGLINEYQFEWNAGEREFRRAIELKPGLPETHHWLSLDLLFNGRFQESLAEADRALQLDPSSLVINNLAGIARVWARDYDGALEAFRKTFDLEPAFRLSHGHRGLAYLLMGRYSEAEAELDQSLPARTSIYRGILYVRSGRRAEALRLVNDLEDEARRGWASAAARGILWIELGDKERGYPLLENACAERDFRMRDLKANPLYEDLRADERFQRVVRCVFPE